MLILHAAQNYPPERSGVPEVVRQISERLAKRGHEVHVATSAVAGHSDSENMQGVHVHRFHVTGNAVTGIRGDSNSYLEFVRSRKWDAIALHCSQVWSTDLLLDEPLSTRLVFVAHGLSAFGDPTYAEYFERLAAWLRQGYVMVSLARSGIEDAEFVRQSGLPESVVIPNGVDSQEWASERSYKAPVGRSTLVNVSNHNPMKAHGRLFQLLELLKTHGVNAELVQIGGSYPAAKWGLGKWGIKGGCWYKCKAKGLFEPRMRFLKGISRAETIKRVQQADLMVHTSQWEASPLVILEAMAAGTPFVSLDVGCVREHSGGIVVEDLQEMAAKVAELLRDHETRKKLALEGVERIRQKHDWERITDAYEELYRTSREARATS